MKCRPCSGTGIGLSTDGTCVLCHGMGEVPDDPTRTRMCPSCKGTGIGLRTDGLCVVCQGYGYVAPVVQPSQLEGPPVIFFKSGQPRTAHLKIDELFRGLTGQLCVCDPYYGTGSLLRLDSLANCAPIRFLTKHPDRNEEKRGILPRALAEWKTQHGGINFRESSTNDLHDRYLLTDNELILMGHGLKDVGNKDSFLIRIPTSIAVDIVKSVRTQFDQEWDKASAII